MKLKTGELEKDLAKQLAELIRKKVSQLGKDDIKWKQHYEYVMYGLEEEIKNTEDLIKDFSESKLSINAIEQEGYLRALKTMVNRFKNWQV